MKVREAWPEISTVIRLTLTVALLYEIWTHSHWSVALALTLIAVNSECQDGMLRRL